MLSSKKKLTTYPVRVFSAESYSSDVSSCPHLKKSSLQYTSSPFEKHLSLRCVWQSAHLRHFECQHRSRTFRMNRSRIGSLHPAHFGMAAAEEETVHLEYYGRNCGERFCACALLQEVYSSSFYALQFVKHFRMTCSKVRYLTYTEQKYHM